MNIYKGLTTLYSTTTLAADDDEDTLTFYTAISTSSSLVGNKEIDIRLSQNYIESLSDEKLVELTNKLDEKEIEINNKKMEVKLDQEKPVVKIYKKI